MTSFYNMLYSPPYFIQSAILPWSALEPSSPPSFPQVPASLAHLLHFQMSIFTLPPFLHLPINISFAVMATQNETTFRPLVCQDQCLSCRPLLCHILLQFLHPSGPPAESYIQCTYSSLGQGLSYCSMFAQHTGSWPINRPPGHYLNIK